MWFGEKCFLIRFEQEPIDSWFEKGFGNVGSCIFAVWGVKPDDVSISITFRGRSCVFLAAVKAFVKST